MKCYPASSLRCFVSICIMQGSKNRNFISNVCFGLEICAAFVPFVLLLPGLNEGCLSVHQHYEIKSDSFQ